MKEGRRKAKNKMMKTKKNKNAIHGHTASYLRSMVTLLNKIMNGQSPSLQRVTTLPPQRSFLT